MQKLNLRRRFKGRAGQLRVNAFLKPDSLFLRRFPDQFLHAHVIDMGHIREPHAQFIYIGSDQRIRRPKGYMILQHHEVPRMERWIDAAGRIGQKQQLRPHQLHQAGGKHHIGYGIAFIIMYSALHAHHRYLAHIAEYEFSGMSRHRGDRESFDFMIIQFRLHPNIIRIVPQPGAKDDRHLRLKIDFLPETLITLH